MTYRQLKKDLRKIGCYEIKDRSRRPHEKWYSPITDEYFPVGRHDNQEVATGTLKSIKEAAGLK